VRNPKNKTDCVAYITKEVIKIFKEKEKRRPDEYIFPNYNLVIKYATFLILNLSSL